jgi:hypothetical protein
MAQPKYNFKSLSLDISSKELMQDKYPFLKGLFTETPFTQSQLDKAIRFMCCAYDPASPLIRSLSDLKARKTQAAKTSGFENYHLIPMDMILVFLGKVVKCREWTLLVATEECYDEYIELLMQPISDNYVLQTVKPDNEEEDDDEEKPTAKPKKKGGDSADEQKKIIEGAQKKSLLRAECSKMLIEIAEHKRVLFEGDADLEQAYESKRHTPESIATAKQ